VELEFQPSIPDVGHSAFNLVVSLSNSPSPHCLPNAIYSSLEVCRWDYKYSFHGIAPLATFAMTKERFYHWRSKNIVANLLMLNGSWGIQKGLWGKIGMLAL